MSINVIPLVEPLSHKRASKIASLANQTAILIKQHLTSGAPAEGNDAAVPASEIKQHFSAADLSNLEKIASVV